MRKKGTFKKSSIKRNF